MAAPNKPLSAFAARQARQASTGHSQKPTPQPTHDIESEDEYFEVRGTPIQGHGNVFGSAKRRPPELPERGNKRIRSEDLNLSPAEDLSLGRLLTSDENRSPASETLIDYETEGSESSLPSHRSEAVVETSRTQEQILSKLASEDQITELQWGAVNVLLRANEKVTVVGLFTIWVRRGYVTIMGAIIGPSPKARLIFAPSTHSLAPIQHFKPPLASQDQDADIVIESASTGLRGLGRLNPSFQNIWNHQDDTFRSFNPLSKSSRDRKARALTAFKQHGDWKAVASKLANRMHHEQVILVCGPQSSGKSTFTKFMTNLFLTTPRSSNELPDDVAFIDLDPGQPEYSPPGDISLMNIVEPNFGPAYSHPVFLGDQGNRVMRAHHIGQVTPAHDVEHYLACTKDLFTQHLTSKPLIVNACGWTHGAGIGIIKELLRSVAFTDIVLFSNRNIEPSTAATELEIAVRQYHRTDTKVYEVTYERHPSRSARDLRHMQTMSYFHSEKPIAGQSSWNHEPLFRQACQTLRYMGSEQDICGVMVYGNCINAELLPTIINGRILALVAIEDPSLLVQSHNTRSAIDPNDNSAPLLIPYLFRSINSGTADPLPPSKSRCIGQVLVRGVDIANGTLHVYCPLNLASVVSKSHAASETLVLVCGRLDAPSWAYTEEFYEAQAKVRDEVAWEAFHNEDVNAQVGPRGGRRVKTLGGRKVRGHGLTPSTFPDFAVEGADEFGGRTFDPEAWAAEQPWVEIVRRSGGGAAGTGTGGAKKWRVRRNLGAAGKRAAA